MAGQTRAGGLLERALCLQLGPSHSHVADELELPELGDPPKRTETRRAVSYAIAAADKAGGEVCGDLGNQLKPSHSQVSWKPPDPPVPPPNRTVTPRDES